ncbi:MAG: PAS domain S-box protein, partial [Cytophagaceae bacterium]
SDGRIFRVEESRVEGGGCVSICVDITELKQKEESFALLFQRTPMAIWVVDPLTAKIFAANEAALSYYGYKREELIGLTANRLLPADEWKETRRIAGAGDFDHDPTRVWRHVRADGEELLVLPFVRHLPFGGRPAIVIAAFDVTERHRAELALEAAKEEAEAANRSKSAFLANMSHEIRTPLNGVVAVADLLAKADLAPTALEMVELIRSSSQTLGRLLSDILDLARVESGRLMLEEASFDFGQAVREVGELCRR